MSSGKDPPDIQERSCSLMNMDSNVIFQSGTTNRTNPNKRSGEPVCNQVNKVLITSSSSKNPKNSELSQKQNRLDTLNKLKNNVYKPSDSGPFIIFIESVDNSAGNIHPMVLGKMIWQLHKDITSNIVHISSSGRNRIKIETKTHASANSLINLDVFKQKNLHCYIPSFFINKMGVIRNVSTDLSEEEILENISSSTRVKNIRRLTKRVVEEGGYTKNFPLGTCIVTFDSQSLPEFVNIYGMRCKVDPYVAPVKQCFNCLRFNHLKDQCRGKSKCVNCSQEHPSENCSNAAKCLHCAGNHRANDRKCPKFIQLLEEKKSKTLANTMYSKIVISNRFNLLENQEDFPVPAESMPAKKLNLRKHLSLTNKKSGSSLHGRHSATPPDPAEEESDNFDPYTQNPSKKKRRFSRSPESMGKSISTPISANPHSRLDFNAPEFNDMVNNLSSLIEECRGESSDVVSKSFPALINGVSALLQQLKAAFSINF